jgi:TolB-like protein
MGGNRTALLALVAIALSAGPSLGADRGFKRVAEHRTALVVGNGAYARSPLKNPAADAKLVARTLEGLGFDVTLKTDVDQRGLAAAVRAHGARLREVGGVGVFYFAGHGVQVAGNNYLLPVRANIKREKDVAKKAVDLGRVLGALGEAENRLNVVILDACRNNPFSDEPAGGLATPDAPSGTLISFATAPGSVAADGEGDNGVFTAALVRNMQTAGVRVEDVFKSTRVEVRGATGGKQTPWESSSLEGDFFFKPGAALSSLPVAARPVAPQPRDVTVAVAALAMRGGGPDLAWLGASFSDALLERLSESKKIRVVEREFLETLVAELELTKSGKVDESSAAELGKLLGARVFVFGSVAVLGPQAKIRARLVNVERGEVIKMVSTLAKKDDLFGAQEDIAKKVMAALDLEAELQGATGLERTKAGVEVHRLLARARSLEARLPPLGARARGPRVDEARAAAAELCRAAPSVGLAHLLEARALIRAGDINKAEAALQRAKGVSEHELELVRAALGLARGQAAGAATSLAKLARARPDDGRVWYALARALASSGDPAGAATALLDAAATPTPLPGVHAELMRIKPASLPAGPARAALEAMRALAAGKRASAKGFYERFPDLYLVAAAESSSGKGRVDRARAAVKARPDAPLAHRSLAVALDDKRESCADARRHAQLAKPKLTLKRCK